MVETATDSQAPTESGNSRVDIGYMAMRARPHTYAALVTGGRWKPFACQTYAGHKIARVVDRGNGRLILNWPPRHGKSDLASIWTPLWYLDIWPERRIILTGHTAEWAAEYGGKCRNAAVANELCGVRLSEDTTAKRIWHTREGGGMFALGVGGALAGRGGDLIIIDDPYKTWAQAHSRAYERTIREWFEGSLYSRREPGATIIVVMHRWTDHDLTGWLLEEHPDDWEQIRMAARAEPGDPLGREDGAPLCPERFGIEDFAGAQTGSTAVWRAMYQQDPQSFVGGRTYYAFGEWNVDDLIALSDALPLHVSVDFNRNPHMHCVIGQYDPVADLFTAHDEIASASIKNARDAGYAIADWIKTRGNRWKELQLFGDATGRTPNTETSQSGWQVLQEAIKTRLPGLRVRRRVPAANPHVADTLEAMHAAMRGMDNEVHYKIRRCCKTLLRDYKQVTPNEDDLIDKTADPLLTHASDAERYRVNYLRPVRVSLPTGGGRVLFGKRT